MRLLIQHLVVNEPLQRLYLNGRRTKNVIVHVCVRRSSKSAFDVPGSTRGQADLVASPSKNVDQLGTHSGPKI